MSKATVYSKDGKEVGSVNLNSKIFGVKINPLVVQQAVRTQHANQRSVIAHAKDRSEVRGGGRKPWRQKGTGRARHGSIRSPLWKGGGVTFGPSKDRNYSLKMNKKAKRNALLMCLSDKADDKKVIVLDELKLSSAKTKDIATMIKKLPIKGSVLIALPSADETIIKSARNLTRVKTMNADSLNVMEVLRHQNLLVTKDSLKVIDKTFLN